jgi:PAS domain S-box-containing protein
LSNNFPTIDGVRAEEQRTADGGIIGVCIDVTELKHREASFRLLFEHNPIPMWVLEQDSMRFLAVNDAAVEHYGFSREQFLAMDAYEIRPPEDRERFRQFVETGTGDFGDGQARRHVKADGTAVDVVMFSARLTYQGRQAWLGAAVDVTERNRDAAKVRDTQEFLDTIVENVPVSIIVKNADDFRYVLVNGFN